MTGHAVAGPSLALIKYWGKRSAADNTPATGSLAVTLAGLESRTSVRFDDRDSVVLDGREQALERFDAFLLGLKRALGLEGRGLAFASRNTFPTAAGLASSSSGFAALVGAAAALCETPPDAAALSALARLGSGSATRPVYGGFTVFEAGALAALPEHDEHHWPEFRVLLCIVRDEAKPTSSRDGMEVSRLTSPYYPAWVEGSPALLAAARGALTERRWDHLGPLIRQSYLRMFGTMFSSEPPLVYWQPESLAVIKALEALRDEGYTAWETMDAGPQVKVFCPADQADALSAELNRRVAGLRVLVAAPGPGLRFWREP